MDKYSGKKLDGRYEIHELIGVGGMAYVYRCTDIIDDREVAVKILKDEFLNNEEFIRRFKNESKAIAMLSHPNIVKVYDVSFGDMIQYIVMEYIDGITLKEYIGQQGVLDWREALHLTTQILKALQHAHTKGVIHRDIKPHNIMLLQDGTIKVTDFGIARLTDTQTKTMTEQAIGSVHYIAPEQAKGSKTDGKSDIYSVGVMLYEMLTGKLPFDADSAVSVALMQLQSTPVMPREINPGIPLGLEQITMHAMQKNPAQRYATALDMLGDLERFRLNPEVRFDYKFFVDSDPTKFVKNIKTSSNDIAENSKQEKQKKQKDNAEELDEKKSHSRVFCIVVTVIVFAVLASVVTVAACLAKNLLSSTQNSDVKVPNYIGKTIVEAQEKNPNNFKFEIKKSPNYDKSKKEGEIVKQDPKAGSKLVKEGAKIELTINSEETEYSVPPCRIDTADIAKSKIKSKNLVPKIVEVYDSEAADNVVISTFPPEGVKVKVGTTVLVYLSRGVYHEKISVPNISDETVDEATSILQQAKLEVKTVTDDESLEPEGTITGQSPLQYSKVDENSVVTIYVSSGKGGQKEFDIDVPLPSVSVDDGVDVTMKVFVDGKLDESLTQEFHLTKKATSTQITVRGKGEGTVIIMLNNALYIEYDVDFSSGKILDTQKSDYTPDVPEPEPEPDDPDPEDPDDPSDPDDPEDPDDPDIPDPEPDETGD